MTDIIMLEHDNGMDPTIIIFDEFIDITEFRKNFDKLILDRLGEKDFEYDELYDWIDDNYEVKQFIFTSNITERVII